MHQRDVRYACRSARRVACRVACRAATCPNSCEIAEASSASVSLNRISSGIHEYVPAREARMRRANRLPDFDRDRKLDIGMPDQILR